MTYDDILFASNGTDASEAALDHALQFADAFDATLHVVYVLDVAEHPPGFDDPGEHPELKAERQRALEEPTQRADQSGIDVTTVAVRGEGGDIGDTILAYAREHDVDLVVMGVHTHSGLERFLAGSITEFVVRHAPVPVVTVRPPSTEPEAAQAQP